MNRVDGKVAVVTGGGGGIGRAACELLAKEGAQIVVTDINTSSLEKTVKNIQGSGGSAVAIQQDVSDEADWGRVIDLALEHYKKIDILVNNAGICTFKKFVDIPLEEWKHILNINLNGVFLGTRSVVNAMIDSNQSSGSIINISSISGLRNTASRLVEPFFGDYRYIAPYCASKGGVTMLTKAVAGECGRLGYNIRVNSIHPGSVMVDHFHSKNERDREIFEGVKAVIPLGRVGKPVDIANGVLFLASDESSFMTGSELVIDGGVTAI